VQVQKNVLDCQNAFTVFTYRVWIFVKKITMCQMSVQAEAYLT